MMLRRHVYATTTMRPMASVPIVLLARCDIAQRDRAFIFHRQKGVSEMDSVLTCIACGFARIPLESYHCVQVYTIIPLCSDDRFR